MVASIKNGNITQGMKPRKFEPNSILCMKLHATRVSSSTIRSMTTIYDGGLHYSDLPS